MKTKDMITKLWLAAALCALCVAGAPLYADEAKKSGDSGEELVPLELELPKPLFIGTPRNIVTPNLEEPVTEKRPEFLVPKGVTNIALGKTVTSSDEHPIVGELALITDGDKEGQDGSFVELGPGLQYVQIDLREQCEIFAIAVWHYHAQAQVYHDVIVRVADDPDFIVNVKTLFNNDHDNTAGFGIGKDKEYIETFEGRLIDGKGAKARYVRLYSDGNTTNDMNHYIEVEVYGRPVE